MYSPAPRFRSFTVEENGVVVRHDRGELFLGATIHLAAARVSREYGVDSCEKEHYPDGARWTNLHVITLLRKFGVEEEEASSQRIDRALRMNADSPSIELAEAGEDGDDLEVFGYRFLGEDDRDEIMLAERGVSIKFYGFPHGKPVDVDTDGARPFVIYQATPESDLMGFPEDAEIAFHEEGIGGNWMFAGTVLAGEPPLSDEASLEQAYRRSQHRGAPWYEEDGALPNPKAPRQDPDAETLGDYMIRSTTAGDLIYDQASQTWYVVDYFSFRELDKGIAIGNPALSDPV